MGSTVRCCSSRGSNHGGAGLRKERVGKPNLTGTEIQPGWIHPRQGLGLVSQRDLGPGGNRRKGFGPDDSGASAPQTATASAKAHWTGFGPVSGGFVHRRRRICPPETEDSSSTRKVFGPFGVGRPSGRSTTGALVLHCPHSKADRRSARVSAQDGKRKTELEDRWDCCPINRRCDRRSRGFPRRRLRPEPRRLPGSGPCGKPARPTISRVFP